MMTSLSQKMAILEPTLMLVELPEDDALGRSFFEACGFTERDVLTDYSCAGEAPAGVPGVDLVAGVAGAELVSQTDFEAVPELDRCWQRSYLSIRNLRDRPRGLAIATDRGFEAWLLHRGDGDAETPLPFLAAPPTRSPVEVLALGGKMPVPALVRPLLAVASDRAGRSLHLPRVHPSEVPAGRLEEYGFSPGARTIRYESEAAPG